MIKLDAIELPVDLIWLDEYKWAGVAQQVDVMADGAVVVQADAQATGRPITLAGGDNFGWIVKSVLEELRALARAAGQQMTLTLHDGSTRNVVFIDERLSAEQVCGYSDPAADHPYVVTLYLMEL